MVSRTFEVDKLIEEAAKVLGDLSETLPKTDIVFDQIQVSIIDDHNCYAIEPVINLALLAII